MDLRTHTPTPHPDLDRKPSRSGRARLGNESQREGANVVICQMPERLPLLLHRAGSSGAIGLAYRIERDRSNARHLPLAPSQSSASVQQYARDAPAYARSCTRFTSLHSAHVFSFRLSTPAGPRRADDKPGSPMPVHRVPGSVAGWWRTCSDLHASRNWPRREHVATAFLRRFRLSVPSASQRHRTALAAVSRGQV